MKITRKQLKKLINESIEELNESEYDVPDRRTAAMNAARAEIEKKFGKGSIVDTGAGNKLSNDWMRFVMRNPRYQDTLLHVWDHLTGGDNPSAVKEIYLNDLDNDNSVAGAITFYGRRIRQGESYLSSDEIRSKIEAERADRAEKRKNAPPKKWTRPKYGMGTRIDPETGEEVTWTGTHERFN